MNIPEALTRSILDKNAPNSVWWPGCAQTPMGELTAVSRPHSWIKGRLLLREGDEKGVARQGSGVSGGEKGK